MSAESVYADTFALTVRVCVRICTRRSDWVILRLGSSSRKLKIDTLIMAMPKRTHFKADRNTTEFNLYQKIHCRSFKILQLRYKHLCSLYWSVKNSISVNIITVSYGLSSEITAHTFNQRRLLKKATQLKNRIQSTSILSYEM